LGDVNAVIDDPVRQAAETAARDSYGKLIAFLVARTGDLAEAEDALSDAFATALADWPVSGIPANPRAWLATVARRKQLDQFRRRTVRRDASDHVALLARELDAARSGATAVPDERLGLMFVCAHPAIDPGVRAPLMLRTVLGLDTAIIASAFLVAPATMGQRLVRAQSRIKVAGIPFRVPETAELRDRLDAVLDAIYAAFAAGWSDPAGTEVRRRDLASDAIWLGRLIVSLLPAEPEALGLQALMLYAEARRAARRDGQGEYVPLAEQDPSAWDQTMIAEAETVLRRAGAMGVVGRFQLEAAIQSAHVVRRLTGRADWVAIERLYAVLETMTGSPVVTINRAIAIAETQGAEAGLLVLNTVASDGRVAEYQPYWAARAGLLARVGDTLAADHAYRQAIGLEPDPAVRRFLVERQAGLPKVCPRIHGSSRGPVR
jgi:RNA polymerase sigma-70 factor, ECF subfamily